MIAWCSEHGHAVYTGAEAILNFTRFDLEEWQSRYETRVAFNLADSGVQPLRLKDLVPDPAAVARLLSVDLHYPPVGGTESLRRLIGDWHAAAATNVLVTVGAAEANAITVASLVQPGDHVVVMEPGYRQVRGCALNAGAVVDCFPLDQARAWRPDLDALRTTVRATTRLIAVTNPSNPVGTVLAEDEMDAVVSAADRVGAWILADEVYRGTERLTHTVTPSFFGRYDRVVCVGSLSKAFGLPGLRLGWLVAPPEFVQDAWRRHEYATISASILSMHLGEIALEPERRAQLLGRGRALIRDGYACLEHWIDASPGQLSISPPQATALGFVRYEAELPSVEVANALRRDANVLVGPGAHFGVEQHLRLACGLEPAYLDAAFQRVASVMRTLGP